MSYSFDDQQTPLISMRVYGWLTEVELDRLVADLDRLHERGQEFAVILDCRGLRAPEIAHVRRLRDWYTATPERYSPRYRGLAIVADTPLLRGTLRAVLQGRPLTVPHTIAGDPVRARAWAEAQLRAPASLAS